MKIVNYYAVIDTPLDWSCKLVELIGKDEKEVVFHNNIMIVSVIVSL